MAGKQAKILTETNVRDLLTYALSRRYPLRNTVIVLLSVKAGLRAGEIAKLTWEMLVQGDGQISGSIEVHNRIAKKGSGRRVPLHAELRAALETLAAPVERNGPIVRSERGGPMRATSVVLWFRSAYRSVGLGGCSSHSGRRTFITRAARLVHKAGGSLRDVQLLAGHRSIQTTQAYIEGDSDAQRKLVSLL
jgi:integrase/recombinase XerD